MSMQYVRAHRRRLGLSQEELAARAGLSVRSIQALEAGRVRAPRTSTVRLLADAFELRAAEREMAQLRAQQQGLRKQMSELAKQPDSAEKKQQLERLSRQQK